MGCTGISQDYLRIADVFSLDPDRFFPYAQIDVVEFPDGEGGDRLIEHAFKGPLHQQLEDALRYLSNSVVAEHVIKQPDGSPSVCFFNYPPEALKEALANAVYHKGYDSRANGSPDPLFETDDERLYFMITIFEHSAECGKGAKNGGAPASRVQTRAARRTSILEYLERNPDSTADSAAEALGIPRPRSIATSLPSRQKAGCPR